MSREAIELIERIANTYGLTYEELTRPMNDPYTDSEILEESALCMAQATIQNAITKSNLSRAELARRLGTSRAYVSKMLNSEGGNNLTIKTMARILLCCGYEMRFELVPISLSE